MGIEDFMQNLLGSHDLWSEQITLSRGEYLVKSGQVERKAYFVESGALRIYYLTEHEEHTIRFGYHGSITTSLSSFIDGQPSEFAIQAIRKTTLRSITKENLMSFIGDDPVRLKAYTQLLEGVVIQQVEREVDLLTNSPVERLKRVMKRSPQLFQEVPAKYIASYLRMTPETLSRIQKS